MSDEPKRKFKGVFIHKKVWLHPDFSWLEKCVIAEIDSLSDETEPCVASNEHLAKMFQVSCRRMINILSDLRKKKAIKTVSFNGKRRGMIVNPKLSALPVSGNPALPVSGNPALPVSGNPEGGCIYKEEVLEEIPEEEVLEKKTSVLPPEAEYWNQQSGLRKITSFGTERERKLKARRREAFWVENFRLAVSKVLASDFCMGKSERGWTADFDFLLRPDKFAQLVEGKYDNRGPAKQVEADFGYGSGGV